MLLQRDPQGIENAGHVEEKILSTMLMTSSVPTPRCKNTESGGKIIAKMIITSLFAEESASFTSDPVLLSQFMSMSERIYLYSTITIVA